MVSGLCVYVFLSWLAVSRVDAGSGCNEAADDPGPWVSQLDMQKTEVSRGPQEGFELTLHLVGGDVASSSTESVELLVTGTLTASKQHLVLKKTGTRKGGIMEARTEESLPAGVLDLTVSLAEYNGNAHGPEVMRCTPQGQNFSCLRVQKALVTENQAQSPGQQGQQGQQGKQGQQQRSVQTPGEMHGMHGMGHMQGMHEQMQHAGHSRPGDASGASGLRQAMPMAPPLALGDVCMPGRSRCPGGSSCKAGVDGFRCQEPMFSGVKPESYTLTQSLRMALVGALALFLCLCTLGCFYRRRFRESRTFDELPKVMGKTNLDLPTLKPRKYIEASDSDEEYRTF